MSCYRYWRKHGSFVHFAEVIVPVVESAIRGVEEPGAITVYDLPACNVCGVGFTPAEWEDRHEGHEPDCPGAMIRTATRCASAIWCTMSTAAPTVPGRMSSREEAPPASGGAFCL